MRIGDHRVDEKAIEERFIRSSGPGGQNVNKVASAVQLRFQVSGSGLPPAVQKRLIGLAGSRATADGIIIIEASEYREQSRNRVAARDRLRRLIEKSLQRPKKRIPTRPTLGSKKRRLETKSRRAGVKNLRGRVTPED